ncbi:MAG: cupin domain-containing protein [Candidatus Competibacteraceae bacterium]|nr:cupin domain-containing protein [Candidatus Competibacteraceae bacterium]MBK8964958.1 cupin domain-containing protein [Candidatus Competibacteraceae bacterium]
MAGSVGCGAVVQPWPPNPSPARRSAPKRHHAVILPVGNLFAGIPATLASEQFDELLHTESCRLERIVSSGQATPAGEWYDQAWDEWVVLLQGQAALLFAGEDAPRLLNPGDYVYIPAHYRHRVEQTSETPPAVWLALHLAGSDAGC